MIKNILFVSFLFSTSFVFSQNKDGKITEQADSVTVKDSNTPKIITFAKNELNKNINQIKIDTLPKPELKSFAIYKINTTSKKNDSIVLPKPELIPYSGYKKGKDY